MSSISDQTGHCDQMKRSSRINAVICHTPAPSVAWMVVLGYFYEHLGFINGERLVLIGCVCRKIKKCGTITLIKEIVESQQTGNCFLSFFFDSFGDVDSKDQQLQPKIPSFLSFF